MQPQMAPAMSAAPEMLRISTGIDSMSFDIVQNKLKSRQRPGQTNEISLFAGLLKCGECGKSLTVRYTNAKHPQRIYSCNAKSFLSIFCTVR